MPETPRDRRAPRILIVDDNRSIHDDIRKILTDGATDETLADLEAQLFGTGEQPIGGQSFRMDSTYQGEEAVAAVRAAFEANDPYAVAFVDVRMPREWTASARPSSSGRSPLTSSGDLHSVRRLRVGRISRVLKTPDQYLILKKPFDNVEVRQLACALSEKWALRRRANATREELERMVASRTRELRETTERLLRETEERKAIEIELRNAQKLEAIGRLAAGIAHEINTPLQFIGDNVAFLSDAMQVLWRGMGARAARAAVGAGGREEGGATVQWRDEQELEYVRRETPLALEQTAEGLERVKQIVRALREFAHPDSAHKEPADINHALESSIEVARNEFKSVADVVTDFGELPPVSCYVGHLNQVFLNLIVNAAQAIADQVVQGAPRGRITIRTTDEGDAVVVQISDTGGGVPEAIREKIFEPFFTTKEVGRGTGQGLAIARSIVVDKHGGTLTLDTTEGVGSTFTIRLPR